MRLPLYAYILLPAIVSLLMLVMCGIGDGDMSFR